MWSNTKTCTWTWKRNGRRAAIWSAYTWKRFRIRASALTSSMSKLRTWRNTSPSFSSPPTRKSSSARRKSFNSLWKPWPRCKICSGRFNSDSKIHLPNLHCSAHQLHPRVTTKAQLFWGKCSPWWREVRPGTSNRYRLRSRLLQAQEKLSLRRPSLKRGCKVRREETQDSQLYLPSLSWTNQSSKATSLPTALASLASDRLLKQRVIVLARCFLWNHPWRRNQLPRDPLPMTRMFPLEIL